MKAIQRKTDGRYHFPDIMPIMGIKASVKAPDSKEPNTRHESFQLPRGTQFEHHINTQFSELSKTDQALLVTCYTRLFNKSWAETWTSKTATALLKKVTNRTDGTPLIGLLKKDHVIIGFFIGKIKKRNQIRTIDFPYTLNNQEKKDSVARIKYLYQNVLKQDTFFLIQEFGVMQDNTIQTPLTPYFISIIFKHLENLSIKSILYWTNTKSKSFDWGLSIQWIPIHFYMKDDLVLMKGNVHRTLEYCFKLSPINIKIYYKEMRQNKDNFLCST